MASPPYKQPPPSGALRLACRLAAEEKESSATTLSPFCNPLFINLCSAVLKIWWWLCPSPRCSVWSGAGALCCSEGNGFGGERQIAKIVYLTSLSRQVILTIQSAVASHVYGIGIGGLYPFIYRRKPTHRPETRPLGGVLFCLGADKQACRERG